MRQLDMPAENDIPCAVGTLHYIESVQDRMIRRLNAVGFGENGEVMRGPYEYHTDLGIHVVVSIDFSKHGALLHVSISKQHREPSWGEIKAIREVFFPPDIDVMMVLPKKEDYVNLHQYCFHLWQTPSSWDIR